MFDNHACYFFPLSPQLWQWNLAEWQTAYETADVILQDAFGGTFEAGNVETTGNLSGLHCRMILSYALTGIYMRLAQACFMLCSDLCCMLVCLVIRIEVSFARRLSVD